MGMTNKSFVVEMRAAFEIDPANFTLIWDGVNYPASANTINIFDSYVEIISNGSPTIKNVAPMGKINGFAYVF